MDIIFGDCFALGGHQYALILVDVTKRYFWIYGMLSLSSMSITSALEIFKADVGRLPNRFHSNFDRKLIGGNALRWIISNGSNVVATPAGRQFSIGLAYYNPNGESIYHIKASRPIILALRGTTRRHDAESSPWLTRPHTNYTI